MLKFQIQQDKKQSTLAEFDKSKNFALYEAYSETMTRLLKSLRDMDKYNIWLTCLDKLGDKDGSDTVTLDLVQKSLSKKKTIIFSLFCL